MFAIGVSSNQWAHPATRAPPGHVQKDTCSRGKTKIFAERAVTTSTRKISYDYCNRQADKPPGPCSHLNKPTRRDLPVATCNWQGLREKYNQDCLS